MKKSNPTVFNPGNVLSAVALLFGLALMTGFHPKPKKAVHLNSGWNGKAITERLQDLSKLCTNSDHLSSMDWDQSKSFETSDLDDFSGALMNGPFLIHPKFDLNNDGSIDHGDFQKMMVFFEQNKTAKNSYPAVLGDDGILYVQNSVENISKIARENIRINAGFEQFSKAIESGGCVQGKWIINNGLNSKNAKWKYNIENFHSAT